MNIFRKTLLAAAAVLTLAGAASADQSGRGIWQGSDTSVDTRQSNGWASRKSFGTQQFQNPRTGRHYTALIQSSTYNSLDRSPGNTANSVKVRPRGNGTQVLVNQTGNFNHTTVVVVGH